MRIHSDSLTSSDLYEHVPRGCHLEAIGKGSRKRDHAFEVHMSAAPGIDSHGIKRCYAANTGQYGGPANDYEKAATYVEWGDWMVELLKIDPTAIIGPYEGAAGFVEQTTRFAPRRPEREDAEPHARRWADELAAVAVA